MSNTLYTTNENLLRFKKTPFSLMVAQNLISKKNVHTQHYCISETNLTYMSTKNNQENIFVSIFTLLYTHFKSNDEH